jgi:hypothetical protein
VPEPRSTTQGPSLMALYFCQFSLGSAGNAYSHLLSSLSGKRCAAAFATLNYDCLLESALEMAGASVNHLLQGGPHGAVVVMKPHGSCNFVMNGLGSNIRMTNVTMAGMGKAYYEGPLMAIPPRKVPESMPRVHPSRRRLASIHPASRPRCRPAN